MTTIINHGKYPDSFYRVSIKAVIKNMTGEVLAVKEHSDDWELPGGGLGRGESVRDGLKRELKEELGIDNEFGETFRRMETHYLELIEGWKMVLVYDVVLEGGFTPKVEGVKDLKFLSIDEYNRNRRKDVEPEL